MGDVTVIVDHMTVLGKKKGKYIHFFLYRVGRIGKRRRERIFLRIVIVWLFFHFKMYDFTF